MPALRDPAFAEADVTKHFASWLDVGEDVLTDGADLSLLAAAERAPPARAMQGLRMFGTRCYLTIQKDAAV